MAITASKRQKRLATLMSETSGAIRATDAMRALGIERKHASELLARWHKQGVVRRVSHGLYVPVQPSALGQRQVLEDPWVLAPNIYAPGYIGGWSALEHWGLTEQIFRTICVLTSKRNAHGKTNHQGVGFFAKHVPKRRLYGTKAVWRSNTRVLVSDPHKTILDCVDDPRLGAGLQHLEDCMREYTREYGKPEDLDVLLDHAVRTGNGALFKKLGYLAERTGFGLPFVEECRSRLTKGYATLDRGGTGRRLVTRWNLWVPAERSR